MSDAIDPSQICRDESCPRVGLHRKHLRALHAPPKAHHRPGTKPVWKQDDPDGVRESVMRATGIRPAVIQEIVRDVRDDYGTVSERTIYRRVRELVERGKLIKLDLGFTFAAYIQPGARLLRDPETMREMILGELDFGRACSAKTRYEPEQALFGTQDHTRELLPQTSDDDGALRYVIPTRGTSRDPLADHKWLRIGRDKWARV